MKLERIYISLFINYVVVVYCYFCCYCFLIKYFLFIYTPHLLIIYKIRFIISTAVQY